MKTWTGEDINKSAAHWLSLEVLDMYHLPPPHLLPVLKKWTFDFTLGIDRILNVEGWNQINALTTII